MPEKKLTLREAWLELASRMGLASYGICGAAKDLWYSRFISRETADLICEISMAWARRQKPSYMQGAYSGVVRAHMVEETPEIKAAYAARKRFCLAQARKLTRKIKETN